MDKDLAPRQLFNYLVFTIGLVIAIISIIHLSAMDFALKSHDFGPFHFDHINLVLLLSDLDNCLQQISIRDNNFNGRQETTAWKSF